MQVAEEVRKAGDVVGVHKVDRLADWFKPAPKAGKWPTWPFPCFCGFQVGAFQLVRIGIVLFFVFFFYMKPGKIITENDAY